MSAFTPGPWDIAIIAEKFSNPADALLVAAAPEMYEALIAIKQFGELGCVDVGSHWTGGKKPATKDVWQFPRHMLTEIDAALHKATGS